MSFVRQLVARSLAATHVIPRTRAAPLAAPPSTKPIPLPFTLPDSFIAIDPTLSRRPLHSADSATSTPHLSFEEVLVAAPSGAAAAAAGAQTGPSTHTHQQQQLQHRSSGSQQGASFSPPLPSSSTFTAVVIHGMLGSGRNWRTPSKLLGQALLQSHSQQSQVGGQSGESPSHPLSHTREGNQPSFPLHCRFLLVDLRNHGASASSTFPPPNTIAAAAADVARLVNAVTAGRGVDAVIGHSLGGKVALELARIAMEGGEGSGGFKRPPKQVWVLDSLPCAVPPTAPLPGDVEAVIDALKSLPPVIPSRKWLVESLQSSGFSAGLAEWLATNLRPLNGTTPTVVPPAVPATESANANAAAVNRAAASNGGRTAPPPPPASGFKWAFNIDGAAEMYDSYKRLDLLPFLYRSCDSLSHPTSHSTDSQQAHAHTPSHLASTTFHFVRAERSHMWSPDTLAQLSGLQEYAVSKSNSREESSSVAGSTGGLDRGAARGGSVIITHLLHNAGHWLHMDNPTGLVSLMAQHMGSMMHS